MLFSRLATPEREFLNLFDRVFSNPSLPLKLSDKELALVSRPALRLCGATEDSSTCSAREAEAQLSKSTFRRQPATKPEMNFPNRWNSREGRASWCSS